MSSGSGEILKSCVRQGAPHPVHRCRRDTHPPGQFTFRPVRGALGRLFQGPHYHLLDLGVGDRAGHPGAGLVAQPVQPAGQEPGPPLGDRGPADAQPRGDGDIGRAVRAGQHDPRPQRQPLRGLPPLRPVLQCPPLGFGQHQRLQPVITHTASRLQTGYPVTIWPRSVARSDSRGEKGTQDRNTSRGSPGRFSYHSARPRGLAARAGVQGRSCQRWQADPPVRAPACLPAVLGSTRTGPAGG